MNQASVTLYIWPAFDGLPSSSPFCAKVDYALRYAKIPYQTVILKGPKLPSWSVRDRLPIAEIGSEKLEDSTLILNALDRHFGSKLYPSESSAKMEALLLEEWADESLVLHMAMQRWVVAENWEHFKKNFIMVPKPLRPLILPIIKKDMVSALKGRGIGYADAPERRERFSEALDIMTEKLRSRRFLAGERPSAADFSALPTLQIIRNAKFREITPILEKCQPVNEWMGRMEAEIG